MPGGFGHDSFGHRPFGEAAWARRTLWELIPEIHRSEDSSGLLQAFIEGLYPPFDLLRRAIRDFEELRDPLEVRSQYNATERLKLGPQIIKQGVVEQQGIDGFVDALGQFTANSARFRETEIGKELRIRGSSIPGNNKAVVITADINLTTVATDPALATDAGPLRWELREKIAVPKDHVTVELRGGSADDLRPGWLINDGDADFTVAARRLFATAGTLAFKTEKEGIDGDIDGSLRFAAETGEFTPLQIGQFLSISGSSREENNDKFEIIDVDMSTSPARVLLRGFLTSDTGPLTWALLPNPQLDLYGLALPRGVVEQEATDLAITGGGSGEVTSALAAWTDEDVGKYMDLRGSTNNQNGQYEVLAVTDINTCELDASFATAETGVYWELRASTTTGPTERNGKDLEIIQEDYPAAGQYEIMVPSAGFDPSEVGLEIEISGSSIAGNNTTVTIDDITDDQTAIVSGATLELDAGPLRWELQSADLTKIDARAESIIKFMAPDFGLEIDTQESEARQRSLVTHVNAWLDTKGHESSYEALGAVSGFDVTVFQGYKIDPSLIAAVPDVYEVGEEGTGRSGEDGALSLYGTVGEFYSPTAQFRASDVGLSVRLFNCDDTGNNGLYHIGEYVDANTVRFELPAPTGTLPDYGAGGVLGASTISWLIIRLYTSVAPSLPLYDEIVTDLLEEWIDANPPTGDVFGVDRYCWEDDFAAFVDVTVNSVTNLSGFTFEINVTGPANVIPRDPDGPTRQELDGHIWTLIDSASNEYTVETAPVADGPDWEFEVEADPAVAPATGAGILQYRCRPQFTCDYCGASVVIAVIEPGDVLEESGVALERVTERVIQRLQDRPRPAHVRLVPILKQVLEASLSISVEIDHGVEIYPTLMASITPRFDDIAADDVPLDEGLRVEVDATDTVWGGGGEY